MSYKEDKCLMMFMVVVVVVAGMVVVCIQLGRLCHHVNTICKLCNFRFASKCDLKCHMAARYESVG